MLRLSIARSLLLTLGGLTLVLAVLAGLSVASLYDARQDFEEKLAGTYAAEVAAANLLAASVVEETVVRSPLIDAVDRTRARATFDSAVRAAIDAVRGDGVSRALVLAIDGHESRARRAAERAGRTRGARRETSRRQISQAFDAGRRDATRLVHRQAARRGAARTEVLRRSRRASAAAAAAGALAVLGAVSLIALLIAGLRHPLEDLVRATRRLAGGDLSARVRPAGPAELRELAASFNSMAAELDATRRSVETGRRRLAATIESLSDALVICDAEDRVIELNPRAGELVPELRAGGTVHDSGVPLPALGDALDREATIEHRDRTLSVTAARMGSAGEDGVVWTIRDVTERAQLERAKSDFVATASHELRSPLTSIKGFVELLDAGELTDRQREFVDVILLSTNRLVDLVNDLLDVARVEAGQLHVQRRPIALTDVVREVVALMRPRFDGRQQELVLDVAPDLPAAQGDPARIRQIVTNLLTNAHLYTPEGGSITVGVGAEREWVTLSVADTGRGMSAEQRDRLFERFYRGEAGHTSPGTGLGMSIVRSLVDLHEGGIQVESEPGRGTTIVVRIPRALSAVDRLEPREAVRGRQVLVVEEESRLTELIRTHLGPEDVRVQGAASVPEALAALEDGGFDAAVIDPLLAGGDGFQVLRAIRDDPRLRDLAVVVVSGVGDDEVLAGEWTVRRPVDAGELTTALGSAMTAGRGRVLVVGRPEVERDVGSALRRQAVDYEWATSAAGAARLCRRHRFEVALLDAGMRSPQAVLARLDLRGRRLGRSVFIFTMDADAPGLTQLRPDPVPVEEATRAVVEALQSVRAPVQRDGDNP